MSSEVIENDRLAINGGIPEAMDLPERGLIGSEERAAVLGVVDRAIAIGGAIEYGGQEEEAYCAEFAASLGGGYADAVNSGTSALYVALRALDVEPFTEVIVPAVTDPGGIMPVPLLGCIPVVADTAPGSFNCGPEQIEAVIGPLTSAIVVAHGAGIGGFPVGSFGTVATFSTMWGKHHSTGGQGGVLFTRDADLYHRIRGAADRGKPLGETLPAGHNYLASLNFNQDELSCAIGRAQLAKLPAAAARRQAFVRALDGHLEGVLSVQRPDLIDGAEPTWWFLRLRYRPAGDWNKERSCAEVAAEGVPVNPSYAALPATYTWFQERQV